MDKAQIEVLVNEVIDHEYEVIQSIDIENYGTGDIIRITLKSTRVDSTKWFEYYDARLLFLSGINSLSFIKEMENLFKEVK